MQVRWTTRASEDRPRIAGRIPRDNPIAVRQAAKTLYDGAVSLEAMPYRGRGGRTAGARELVFAPYDIEYRVEAEIVEILRIYHNTQDWPRARTTVAPRAEQSLILRRPSSPGAVK